MCWFKFWQRGEKKKRVTDLTTKEYHFCFILPYSLKYCSSAFLRDITTANTIVQNASAKKCFDADVFHAFTSRKTSELSKLFLPFDR